MEMSISINGAVAAFNTVSATIVYVDLYLKLLDKATCIHLFDCHSLKTHGICEILTYVKLKISVHCPARTPGPTTCVRLEPVWVNLNTCAQILERMLQENGIGLIADQLD